MSIDRDLLHLAGEYRVCSEILKRGVYATITYANKKAVDILGLGTRERPVKIEVKSSNSAKFVTSFYQKYKTPEHPHPDWWVLISFASKPERIFILSHEAMAHVQADVNGSADKTWMERGALHEHGVDNVFIRHLEKTYEKESAWDEFVKWCNIVP